MKNEATMDFPLVDDRAMPPPVLNMEDYAEWVEENLEVNPITDDDRRRAVRDSVPVRFEFLPAGVSRSAP